MTTIPSRQHPVNASDASDGRRTPAGDAFSGLVARVFRLNGLLAAAGDALSRPSGQTSARWQVLAMLENGPATVAETARVLGLARQSVQRVADLLEADSLIQFVDNPRHRRARLAELTGEGRTVLAAIQAAQRPWANRVGGAVGERELRGATQTLERLIDALEQPPGR
ncbi:MAG TPA: MarR family transcriptional regulator [Candidatus Limnocylindrales bacterium]|jgi:DNA-binding MarR family transcriptional regulator